MSSGNSGPYPGSEASVPELMELGSAYCAAALQLFRSATPSDRLTLAPARLCAIQAIELFENAYLRSQGVSPEKVRARGHRLHEPEQLAALGLRKRTLAHLQTLTERREYLIVRYGPEQSAQHTELNRLTVTLVEVMTKVHAAISRGSGAAP